MKFKKLLSLVMGVSLAVATLAGCGNTGAAENGQSEQAEAQEEASTETTEEATSEESTTEEVTETAEVNTELSGTLKLYGPGLFTEVGPDGSTDIVTGISKPGYNEVIKRWNELYPNVEISVETIPWDNWKAACQTAALSGEVDIILHGSSITAISEPLADYLEKDPEISDAVGMMAMRKNPDLAPLDSYVPYGLTVIVNPVMVVIDKQILNDYGVEIPDYKTWTLDDIKEIAEKTTGTDPVTGEQTYGMSLLNAASANKNYIWVSRAMNDVVYDWGDSFANTKVNFNTDKTAEVLNYICELEKFSSPDYLEGLDTANKYTEDNNLAILFTESAYSAYNTIKANGLEDRYMLATLPSIQGGEFDGITSSHMGDWNMSICNTSTQKDLAWEFLKFMVTDEVVQQWLLDCYTVPANKAACEKLSDYMPAQYAEPISYVVNTSPLMFSASSNDSYDSGNFGTMANDITTVLNEMFQGNMNAEQAMEYVQKNVDDYLDTMK